MVAVWKQLVQTEKRLLQPITWPIYLPCTTAQGQYHCASNIISNPHPFRSKCVDPPIPEIQQFQYFTMNIQGQGHGWGQSLKSQCTCSILLTRIPFVPCQRALPITFVRCWWALTFLSIAIEKLDLENPRSRSWLRWTLKVTPWVQHSIDSHPCRSKSISHPIPEIQHFQNLTLKIQGQGQGWNERWKSQHGSNIISTHIPFVPCQSAIPFLRYNFFF